MSDKLEALHRYGWFKVIKLLDFTNKFIKVDRLQACGGELAAG